MQQGSQSSNPLLSQGRLLTGLQPPAAQQTQVRPFSSIMRSSSMHNTLTLSHSQQQQQQQQYTTPGARGVAKPFSQLRRTDTHATAGLAPNGLQLPLQQYASSQHQHFRPATPPSQGMVFSQPSQLPESDQMTVLGPSTQQPQSQQQPPSIPFTALGNAHKPLHTLQSHQHICTRPGSSNSYGDVPAALRPGSAPARLAAAAAAAKQPPSLGLYNDRSLGKALGQELEGRKVLEAIEGMQVRLSELEASCRSISTLGLTITDSASKLEELAVLHQQLANSVEGVRGMVAQQQGAAAEQQATLAIVASAAAAGGLRRGSALQDAVIAQQVEEEYEAGYNRAGWAAGMQSVHAHAQHNQPRRQQQVPGQQQQQQQQWNSCAQASLSLPASRGGRQGSHGGAPEACLAGAGDQDVCPDGRPPAPSPANAHRLPTAQPPALNRKRQQHQGQQQQVAHCSNAYAAASPSMHHGAPQIGTAQLANAPSRGEHSSHAGAVPASEGGWISRKHSAMQPALPPAKRRNSGGVIARMSGKLEQSGSVPHRAACPIVPAPTSGPVHNDPLPPSASAQGIKGGWLARRPPCPVPHSQTVHPFQGSVGKDRQPAAGAQVAAAPAKKQHLSAASLLASPEMPQLGRQPLARRGAPASQQLQQQGHHANQHPGLPCISKGAGKRTDSEAGFEVARSMQAPHPLHYTKNSRALSVGFTPEEAIAPPRLVGASSTSQSSTSQQQEKSRSGGDEDLEGDEDLARQVAEKMRQHRSRRLRKRL
ncbi:hypothetical protein DUNSADRAFT_14582 [Dunaliella salina]|uniref:Uncharacterized protein n=1 Tax=Dunaliella salina TaxID=3046 RepID=A0ABQ7G731_DUNSA|nr:hypothetical protein DUNSADRAFT_14582 [Dunaliella salina]|eukprot:KAF5830423.1 hypothetical protein DUNSADRAFT_14582 [Dunaliella salina]